MERETDPPTSDVREQPRRRPRVIDHSNFVGRADGSSQAGRPPPSVDPRLLGQIPKHGQRNQIIAPLDLLVRRRLVPWPTNVRLPVNRCGTDVLRVVVFQRSALQRTAQPCAKTASLHTARTQGTGYVAAAGSVHERSADRHPARRALVRRSSLAGDSRERRPRRSWSVAVGGSRW